MKIRRRSGGWNSLRLRSTRPLSTGARSDSTRDFRRSAAGRLTSHPMWAGRFRVGHKPDPDQPVDTPTILLGLLVLANSVTNFYVLGLIFYCNFGQWRPCLKLEKLCANQTRSIEQSQNSVELDSRTRLNEPTCGQTKAYYENIPILLPKSDLCQSSAQTQYVFKPY